MSVRLSNTEKLNLISNFATMLSAGIPLLETIDSLLEEAKGNQKKILLTLKEDINQGKKISDSFARFPQTFDPVTVNLIKAAEQSGTLVSTLKDLIITIKKEMEFTEKVHGALIYPFLVMGVFFAILIVILTFVIPKISQVFGRLNVALPLPTRVLISLSDALLQHTAAFIIGLIIFIVIIVMLYKRFKTAFLNVFFHLPGLSMLAIKIDLTHFTRSLALLLNSGIPIVNALELAQQVVVKRSIATMISDARTMVSAGKPLSESFKKHRTEIPPIMVRITQAGEKSGTLAQSMQDLANFLDEDVSRRVKLLTTLLEPILLVVIAVLVGGMMMSIIAPIYGLIGQINVR